MQHFSYFKGNGLTYRSEREFLFVYMVKRETLTTFKKKSIQSDFFFLKMLYK